MAGRIDLTQAEGLIDLIDAETEVQRKGAMRVAEGHSRRRFEAIRNDIIQCRTLAEAIIDFGEGEEIEEGLWAQLVERTTKLVKSIRTHLNDNRRGEILRSGVKLAIFGAPNAGKSSLLNYLAARPAAIVTPIAGTTRDVLEVSLDIGGIPVRVSDTAGLRDMLGQDNNLDTVEQIGIERAKKAVEAADIRLCVVSLENLRSGILDTEVADLLAPATAVFLNKLDLAGPEDLDKGRAMFSSQRVWIGSVVDEAGMGAFVDGMAELLKDRRVSTMFEKGSTDEEPLITHSRHRTHLEAALQYLEASLAYVRLAAVLVLIFLVFGQICAAAPFVADPIRRSVQSVHVQRPGRLQNVPVAQLGVAYVFQLDPNTFTVVDSDSGAPLKVPPVVALDPDSDIPHWISFDPEKLVLSGTPDAVPSSPFRIRFIATAPESGDQNDTAFDLYVSNTAPPSLVSPLEHQHNKDLMHLVNASRLVTKPGVWIHPGSAFTVQLEPFCNISSVNSSLYYTAYHPSNSSFDPLPDWLHFDNNTLSLTGTAPMGPTSTHVLFRCSNVFGAGGPEQTLLIDITEHEFELDGAPFAFEFTPGQPFKYNFQWIPEQLWLDGDSLRNWNLIYSNDSQFPLNLNASRSEVGLSFSLDNYPWLYFDNINATIYGTPPPTNEPSHELPPVPLNISCRGQHIESNISVYSRDASPWSPFRDAGVVILPDREFSHNFSVDLTDSVRNDPRWDIFIQINDPFNQTSWLSFDAATHVLNGNIPAGSPTRNIDIRLTSNAWGFNSTIPYYIDINNPDWVPPKPVQPTTWSSTSVTVTIALVIIIILLLMFIFMLCGLWHGWLVSPIVLYRRRHRSSQTLVDNSSGIGTGCCKPVSPEHNQVDVERKAEATASTFDAPTNRPTVATRVEHDIDGSVLLVVPSALSSPTSATSPSTLATYTGSISSSAPSSCGPSSPRAKPSTSQASGAAILKQLSPKGKFKLFRKRVTFGRGNSKRKSIQKPAIVVSAEGSLPEPDDDTTTDENLLDRLARSLGSEPSLDEHDDELNSASSHIESESQGVVGSASVTSLAKWKGKGVARGEYGSPTTSQHSPTFKRLARQRFKASIDNTIGGSPLSKMAIARTLAYTSPSLRSIATGASSDLSPSNSLTSLVFHVNEEGVHYYVIPASTRFCFTARITKIDGEEGDDDKPTFGRAKAAVYSVQTDDPNDPSMPLWLHFNAPGLEFWGHAPNADERMQHSMKIVHRASGDIVGRLVIAVARLDDVASTQAALGYPNVTSKAPGVVASSSSSKLAAAINLACSPQISGVALHSSRSIATSHTGTNLSSSGSMTSVVFHLARDGINFFVIPSNTQFCFEVPGLETNTARSTFGRAVASPYMIQMDETSEVVSIPPWLHFVAQSMEFWGEAPDVSARLRVGVKIVQRETGEVAMRLLIVVARLDDVGSLQAELNYGKVRENDGLSVVEEVSSIDSDEDRISSKDEGVKFAGPAEPKTPERSRANISVSSSRGPARSYRGTIRSQPGSKFNSPASRRSPGTGGRGGRMRTPMSARMVGYEDYDSVMFEGQSQYSGSLFGPELGTLAGGAISSGALEAMSRAASRVGSISSLPGEHTVIIAPTVMNGVEYYVIRGGVNFCFRLQMTEGRAYGVEFEVDKKDQDGWTAPEWIR
ncbi:mitochondrial splicing system protein, partial [Ceratobasidium sp. 392]